MDKVFRTVKAELYEAGLYVDKDERLIGFYGEKIRKEIERLKAVPGLSDLSETKEA
jgi:hypothetical protein